MAQASELFYTLRNYVKGKADRYDIEHSDSSVDSVYERDPRGETLISFKFNDDGGFLKFLGLSEDDMFFARHIMNRYSQYGFRSEDFVRDDFLEGFIVFDDFDSENREKIIKILKIIKPEINWENFDGSDNNLNKDAIKILNTHFGDLMDRIVDDWHQEMENSSEEIAREVVQSEINSVLKNLKFEPTNNIFKVEITVDNLINLYLRNGIVWLSFTKLFKDTIKRFEDISDQYILIGGWSDNQSDFWGDDNFDKEGFNFYVEQILDKILSQIEGGEDFQKFLQFYEQVTKKFKPNVTYELPKKKGVTFTIKNFDKENLKVEIVLRKNLKNITRKVNLENFYNLLYQPELFDIGFGEM